MAKNPTQKKITTKGITLKHDKIAKIVQDHVRVNRPPRMKD